MLRVRVAILMKIIPKFRKNANTRLKHLHVTKTRHKNHYLLTKPNYLQISTQMEQ